MLAVDRKKRPSPPPSGREREIAGGNEALFIGKRERNPVLERPERRSAAGEAHDRVQHEIGFSRFEQRNEIAAALEQLHTAFARELRDVARACGEGTELELGIGVDDLERLPTDRAAGAKQSDAFHGFSLWAQGRFPGMLRPRYQSWPHSSAGPSNRSTMTTSRHSPSSRPWRA